jgi:hypothetical protein
LSGWSFKKILPLFPAARNTLSLVWMAR